MQHLTFLSDVEPEKVEWLWPGRLPLGKVTVLDGDPGLGKSTMALGLVARTSTGCAFPGEIESRAPARAVILSAEDGLADTIRPRLDAADADSRMVASFRLPGDRPATFPDDLPQLEAAIHGLSAKLVVVDPFMAFLSGSVDSHRDQDVRTVMAHLAAIAERSGSAILIVRHMNKAGGRPAMYRGMGSIGIIGAARMGLLAGKDPENPDLRILAPVKSNLAHLAPSLRWSLVTASNGVGLVEWLGEAFGVSADDLVAEPAPGGSASKVSEARKILTGLLSETDSPGKVLCSVAQSQAQEIGIGTKTLQRAARGLGLKSKREGFGAGAKCFYVQHQIIPDTSSTDHNGDLLKSRDG